MTWSQNWSKLKTLNLVADLSVVTKDCVTRLIYLVTIVTKLVTTLSHQYQVYPDGIRHIRADKRVNEWKSPGKKTVVRCAVNRRQVVIALSGGELVYFEMDPVSV